MKSFLLSKIKHLYSKVKGGVRVETEVGVVVKIGGRVMVEVGVAVKMG